MSYGFNFTAANKAEAIARVTARFDEVVSDQPVHEKDRAAAQATAEAFINMLEEPAEGWCINFSIHGSLGWRADNEFTTASVGVTAYHMPTV